MRVLGIDPGTATTGFGLVAGSPGASDAYLVDCGVVTTPAHMDMSRRLVELHDGLRQLIAELQPDACAVEELFFNTNATTVISVSQARGVILLTAAQASIPVFEYTPLQVKQALTGYGRADKRQVQSMVQLLLNLAVPPKPDDAADAVAIALTHLQVARH